MTVDETKAAVVRDVREQALVIWVECGEGDLHNGHGLDDVVGVGLHHVDAFWVHIDFHIAGQLIKGLGIRKASP